MAIRKLQVNDQTGQYSLAPSGAFTDYDYDVTLSAGQSVFTPGIGTFSSTSLVECYINGVMKRAGTTKDYTTNVSTGAVTFNYTIPQIDWVKVRVYN